MERSDTIAQGSFVGQTSSGDSGVNPEIGMLCHKPNSIGTIISCIN